jgi:hypothetical protein
LFEHVGHGDAPADDVRVVGPPVNEEEAEDFDAFAFDLEFLFQVFFDRVADLDAPEVFADAAGLLAEAVGPAVGEGDVLGLGCTVHALRFVNEEIGPTFPQIVGKLANRDWGN